MLYEFLGIGLIIFSYFIFKTQDWSYGPVLKVDYGGIADNIRAIFLIITLFIIGILLLFGIIKIW